MSLPLIRLPSCWMGSHPVTSFKLSYSLHAVPSKQSHWGLGHQRMNLGGHTILSKHLGRLETSRGRRRGLPDLVPETLIAMGLLKPTEPPPSPQHLRPPYTLGSEGWLTRHWWVCPGPWPSMLTTWAPVYRQLRSKNLQRSVGGSAPATQAAGTSLPRTPRR